MDQQGEAKAEPSKRRESITSQNSQTAAEYISSQLQLEADAREILPYQFDTCTYTLGPLNQSVFSCLTCNPPPSDASLSYTPAGICYACSISCHGEHELVELFNRRQFVCDCGTTRLPATSTCSLRVNAATGTKGNVQSEVPSTTNTYNQNFNNRFCACAEDYNPHTEKGTMFQCVGLATADKGGCGEDWWHPECIMGLSRNWHESYDRKHLGGNGDFEQVTPQEPRAAESGAANSQRASLDAIPEESGDLPEHASQVSEVENVHPIPPGFPDEDDFDHFICYKCVEANPWLKRYANSPSFLMTTKQDDARQDHSNGELTTGEHDVSICSTVETAPAVEVSTLKRKVESAKTDGQEPAIKKVKSDDALELDQPEPVCKVANLPPPPIGHISLFLGENFRDQLCRCSACFPALAAHPQLLEEEVVYEPPLSEHSSAGGDGTASVGSRSLFDRGEAALSNMDRVRAIEGVMAYNKLRDNLKNFLKPFADSGKAVGAEDIKKHFEKLRGDDKAIGDAQRNAALRRNND